MYPNSVKTLSYAGIKVYPNPSNGIFTIEVLQGFENFERFEITNITGKIIYYRDVTPNIFTSKIDISNQPSGIYFLKLQCNDNMYIKRIIIQ